MPAPFLTFRSFDMAPATPETGRLAVLLVGSAASLAELSPLLTLARPAWQPIGAVRIPAAAEEEAALAPKVPLLAEGVAGLQRVLAAWGGRFERVCLSLPLAMTAELSHATALLQDAGVTWCFLPTLQDQFSGRTPPTSWLEPVAEAVPSARPQRLLDRQAQPADWARLIGRTPRPLDEVSIRQTLGGRVVLITGAGGSIGSELAGSVARFGPAKLVLVERSENALFEIDREIARLFPTLPREAVLHDITRRDHTHDLFARLRPQVVFHAAAHKHVPMMEEHPAEAVENNFYGTRFVADAAAAAGCEKFVMISSDKAVNPSSVMGATKRLAELYVRYLNGQSACTFSMVRFGNVLGSACSVLPIWSRQLQQGGPVTVTHPEMTRYFMTIPEAAGLVLQAAAVSDETGGEVFLLDMGEPVLIRELAERFIRLQGFEPGREVAIQITGIRPGEKLFEELAYHGEDMQPTRHPSIRIWRTEPTDRRQMERIRQLFDRLRDRGGQGQDLWRGVVPEAVVAALRSAVPEMVQAAAG